MIKCAGDFTALMWKEVLPIYEKMINHPFSKGLQNSTLSKTAFSHYLSQDILYLNDDKKAMLILSKRIKQKKQKTFFYKMHEDIVNLEVYFNQKLLKKFRVKKAKKKSKVIKKYTSFLLKTSKHKSIPLALASLLPCFWLYSEVGLKIYKNSRKNNTYDDWIKFYNDKEFLKYTNNFIHIVEKSASNLFHKEQKKMIKYFLKSSKFELDFFDEAIKEGKNAN